MGQISRYLHAQQRNGGCKGVQSFLNAQLVHLKLFISWDTWPGNGISVI